MLPRVEIAKRMPVCSPFFVFSEGHNSTNVGKAVPISVAGIKKLKKLISNGSHFVGSFSRNTEATKSLISGENITNVDIESHTKEVIFFILIFVFFDDIFPPKK